MTLISPRRPTPILQSVDRGPVGLPRPLQIELSFDLLLWASVLDREFRYAGLN